MITFIIVINYKSTEETVSCLKSIEKEITDNYHVVCLDNGSIANGDRLKFKSVVNSISRRNISLLFSEKNLGFAGGINHCLRYIRDNYEYLDFFVWILNNDTTVKPNTLKNLKHKFKKDVSIVGSLILNTDGTIQDVHGYLDKKIGRVATVKEIKKIKVATENRILYPVGASLLTSNKRLIELNDFNEEYFLYFEELDFVLKGIKKNYLPAFATESIVFHKQGSSTRNKDHYFSKNYHIESYKIRGLIKLYKIHFPNQIYSAYIGISMKLIKALMHLNFSYLRCIIGSIKTEICYQKRV